jgi:uncharacterized membrane protein YhaH (DUF805 family)
MSWLFFAFDGRISREVYWLGIGLICGDPADPDRSFRRRHRGRRAGAMIIFVGVIALWAEIALLVKRLHDRDLPGFWALIAKFLPFVGVLWMVLAGLMTGDAGPTATRPPPTGAARPGHRLPTTTAIDRRGGPD